MGVGVWGEEKEDPGESGDGGGRTYLIPRVLVILFRVFEGLLSGNRGGQ